MFFATRSWTSFTVHQIRAEENRLLVYLDALERQTETLSRVQCPVSHVSSFRLTQTLPRRGQGSLRGKRKEMEIEAPAPICS